MFWALAAGRVDTRGLEFEQVVSDIQTLNEWAVEGRLEVTAISAGAYPHVADRYVLLPHGASMGDGYGPIVVARDEVDLHDVEIVIPGRLTTAYLVLRLALGAPRVRELPFDQILDEVRTGRADAGLLIHEGQLTYADAGLRKLLDLGTWWQQETGLPLPLGVNVARRDLDRLDDVSDVLGEAIHVGLENRDEALAYAEQVGFGCANQAGEDNRDVARMAALLAGLPESVAGVTVNRLCASGLAAVVGACHAVLAGDGDLFVAGGVESMSRAPFAHARPEYGDGTEWDTQLGWRFPNPRLEAMFPLESMGETGENVAERWAVSREDQDAFAPRSQQRWAAAAAAGRFDDALVPTERGARHEH